MKYKRFTILISSVILVLAHNANAGLISDTANGSFIDETTGLEWMDFGVNNGQSFNYVASQLGDGGAYDGWLLPDSAQVYAMWSNAFLNKGGSYENPDEYGSGQFLVEDGANSLSSVFTDTFNAMGYNTTLNAGKPTLALNYALGWFAGADGLSWVNFGEQANPDASAPSPYPDYARLYDAGNYDNQLDTPDASYSTLLVREQTVGVSAPPVIAIVTFGLIGLAFGRKKRVLRFLSRHQH